MIAILYLTAARRFGFSRVGDSRTYAVPIDYWKAWASSSRRIRSAFPI